MKSNQIAAAWGVLWCVGLLTLAGCSDRPSTGALVKAFETGSPAMKQIVTNIVGKAEAGLTLTLHDDLRNLWRQPGITQEQREAAMTFTEKLIAYNERLLSATNGGPMTLTNAAKGATNTAGKRALTNRPPGMAAARLTNAAPAAAAPAATNVSSAK